MANNSIINIDIPKSKDIDSALYTAKIIKNTMGRSSLTRAAKDSVMQFPMLISGDIDTEDAIIMAKAFEKQYASMMVSAMSLDAGVNIDKYENLSNYLKKFHSNSDIPANIKAAPAVMESATTYTDEFHELKGIGNACWDTNTEYMVNMESVNDVYRPYDRTYHLLSESLNTMKTAKEAATPDKVQQLASNLHTQANNNGYGGINPSTEYSKQYDNKTGNLVKTTTKKGATPISNTKNSIERNDRLTALEPTLINCSFVMHGSTGSNTQWTQNVLLGVKAMVRVIRSEFMVNNMADAAKNANVIFKFIKWTKGELHLSDILFNKSEIKDMATTSVNDSSYWWKALRRRRMINNLTSLFDQGKLLPSTTILMTSYEVQRVASITGVDLSQPYNALKLISKYYLLGFAIYDTETNILSSVFDGDSDFSDVTLASLKGNSNKDISVMDSKEMRKMMGKV